MHGCSVVSKLRTRDCDSNRDRDSYKDRDSYTEIPLLDTPLPPSPKCAVMHVTHDWSVVSRMKMRNRDSFGQLCGVCECGERDGATDVDTWAEDGDAGNRDMTYGCV